MTMQNYNHFADILDTYQAMPDLLKVLWLVMPPLFVLTLVALLRLSRTTPGHWHFPDENEICPGTLYKLHHLQDGELVAVPVHWAIDVPRLAGPEIVEPEEDEEAE